MEKEVLVKVQNVSKKFCLDLKTSLKYGATDIVKSTLGFKTNKELREKEFWAVHDVSFELRRGECIGLIGHNGAGKSTLLKVLNGLYAPDKGQITMRGKIGALIELGAGFNPILTGRENIYNNAAILGFTRQEVEAKMDSIIAFSEIEKFLDTPVKNYSSGMKVRLGFAVAAHLQPDVLIIDEVLAVGDLGFILKCFKKIDELLPNTAVIFVSHNMPQVSRICNEVILLENGKVKYQGNDVSKGIDFYYKRFSTKNSSIIFDTGNIRVNEMKINGKKEYLIGWNEDVEIDVEVEVLKPTPSLHLYLAISDKEQRGVATLTSEVFNMEHKNKFNLQFKVKNLKLSKGVYIITIKADEEKNKNPLLRVNGIIEFQVIDEEEIWTPFLLDTEVKLLDL